MQVIKIGGNQLGEPAFLEGLARAVAADPGPCVIVHGGGRAIADMQAKLGLEPVKVEGLRVTDRDSLAVAQMVLSGQANKQIVSALLAAGVDALGISGVDRGLLRCIKKDHPTADLGYVGEIVEVRVEVITQLVDQGVTPVVSPISLGLDGQTYNVNADHAARVLAAAVQADRIDLISNVPGVLSQGLLLPSLSRARTKELIVGGVIRDGMLPKVRAALSAVDRGVPRARIVDLAGFEQGGGTFFTAKEVS